MLDWNRIVSEYGPMVFRTAWRILGNAADSDEVTQDVFLQAYQMQEGQPVRCWEALLRRLAACRAIDRLRQRRFALPLDKLIEAGPDNDPEAEAMERELSDRLRQAIARLPNREATVFCLRCFEGLPYETIADTLQISPGAVAVALHKARSRLESLLLVAAL